MTTETGSPLDAGAGNRRDTLDFHPEVGDIRAEVLEGLSRPQKQTPAKYLYDARGSELFDGICEAVDYYPTRTELAILDANLGEITAAIGPRCVLIEPGSGSSMKTEILLRGLEDPVAYVPIEISRDHLDAAAESTAATFPDLEILPVCADFTGEYDAPDPSREPATRVVYFPGSTIGNLTRPERGALLKRFAALAQSGGLVLIGIDLEKDIDVLRRAYDDSEGVTAAVDMNLLTRLNRELDADFDLDKWEHIAVWNEDESRIEMRLRSRADQTVHVGGESFEFKAGETIHTENSHKFTIDGFAEEAAAAGLTLEKKWTDEKGWFAELLFRAR